MRKKRYDYDLGDEVCPLVIDCQAVIDVINRPSPQSDAQSLDEVCKSKSEEEEHSVKSSLQSLDVSPIGDQGPSSSSSKIDISRNDETSLES